jgi:dipeptidyl-peptidase-4
MNSHSQDQSLTLEDLIPGGNTYYKYRAEMPRQLSWLGDNLTYVKGDTIYTAPLNDKQKKQPLITLAEINKGLNLDDSHALRSLMYVSSASPEAELLSIRTYNKSYLFDINVKKAVTIFNNDKGVKNTDLSVSGKSIAYTRDNNLCVQLSDGKELMVTSEKEKGIVSGQSVHRNEFGIEKGTFWSPNGNLLAFYRMDETMVSDYPLVDISARVAELKDIKYPMAGMKSHHVTVGVYNPQTQETVFLQTGTPKEKYLTNIAWSPDEKSIYIAELNRGQDTCSLKRYDALTGKLDAVLFTETDTKYVEPQNPVLFLKNDPSRFIWQSDRDGYNHLYVYDISGKLLKQLTSGAWEVSSVVGFDEKGENVIYVATEDSPIEKHLYKLNLKNGKKVRLSKEEGVHRALLSGSGKYLADSYTSQNNPGKVSVTNVNTHKSEVFHIAKDPYRNTRLPEIELGSLTAEDGETTLYYRMVKPLNYDVQKKYPVIVYVYGGPHSQMVDNSWMGQVRGWDIYMAQNGYIVFTLDNRGTDNRGAEFEKVTHRQLGILETQDQMTGIAYLKSLPYVDEDRIGVHGWSYGGFMTLNLMLRHPEVFKVGVAGGPVTDWKYYEVMYGERYMDTPKENPQEYAESSMVDRAGDLQGRLLLIHGDEDPTVVMQHSLQFLKSAVKKGTHPDFFVYPGQGHNMIGRDRIHLHEHITRYFDDFLK